MGFADRDGNQYDAVTDEFVDYAIQHHEVELLSILEAPDVNAHYSITINFVTLFETSTSIGDGILSQPIAFLPLCDRALIDAQNRVREKSHKYSLVVKVNVHARISALPVCPELYKSVFPRNEELGSFLRISGTVVRRTMPKMLEFKKTYMCNKCKYSITIYAEYEKHYALPPVGSCRNPETCKSANVVPISSPDDFKDYQELKLQEQVGKLDMGSIPKSMLITVEDDLVDACKPGDDVVICGTVRRRWKNFINGSRPEVDLVLQANYLEVCNAQNNTSLVTQELKDEFNEFWKSHSVRPLQGRNFILQCVSPEVYGLYLIKLAVALVLAGGVAQYPGTGARVRGESHLLLVGDPGTAKSQLLRFAAAVSPRSVFTTGIGSTSAGLTVSAAMAAGGEWQLEAGALVLADGGICCIDEFNSIRESERASIHEAMEQQTLSVAKAGMVCKLSTVCSILAATNPKGQFDTAHPITVNCAIASPLLSRFDLVFVLLDRKNKEWDSLISSYIIMDKTMCKSSSNLWNVEKLQAYFSIVKGKEPKLSEDASLILKEYYRIQRRNEVSSASRITVRLLESLVRLAQAHAKLMFRNEVTVQDAVVSVSLMEASHQTSSIDAFMSNPIQTTFPVDPEEEYIEQAHRVLGSLGLHRLLDIEVDRYMRGHNDSHDPPGPEDTPRSRSVLDHLKGRSQLQPEKSDLNKKLDAVFNNIRQNKLREEHKALAFQRTGQSKKRKKSIKGSDKQKKSRKKTTSPSESDSCSDDEVMNKKQKSKRNPKNSGKPTQKQFIVASDSDTDCSLEAPSSPSKSSENIIEFSQFTRIDDEHSKHDIVSRDLVQDYSISSNSCMAGSNSKKATDTPTQISKKTFLNQSIFAADDSESDSETQPSKILPSLQQTKTNVSCSNQNGTYKRATKTSISTKQVENVPIVQSPTSKFQAKTPISTKTISKLKSFAFKETKKTDDQPLNSKQQNPNPADSSSSSVDHSASSEELFNTPRPKTSSSENLKIMKTNSTSTQSSIFCVGDEDNDSDYEL